MEGSFRSARETVTWETPAFWAMSRNVTRWVSDGRASVIVFGAAILYGKKSLCPEFSP
jgi:hypothetical protein